MHSKEMKGTKLLHLHPQPHILQPQDSFWMSSMRGVYARSLNKPQNCPSPRFGTGDVTRALAVPLQWLSWVAHLSSHGAAGLFVAFEDVLPWQTCNRAKSYGLCCHLIIYCSVTYQQHFIRLKTWKSSLQDDHKQRRPFPSQSQEEQNLPAPKATAFCTLTVCTPQVQLGLFQYRCAICGKERPVFLKLKYWLC